jgi:hypothetical protein
MSDKPTIETVNAAMTALHDDSPADYFVHAATFAAPFVSEEITRYIAAETPEAAVETLVGEYRESVGIYAADAFATADDYHRGNSALARWRSNKALTIAEAATPGATIYSGAEGAVEIGGELHRIDDPRDGRFV